MTLPQILPFEINERTNGNALGGVPCYYTIEGTRTPKKGEFFVSGAIPEAYKAYSDLDTEYMIVKPTHRARRVAGFERGEAL